MSPIDGDIVHIPRNTAQGKDRILTDLMEGVGDKARRQLESIFTHIIERSPIPNDWLHSRLVLVPKRVVTAEFGGVISKSVGVPRSVEQGCPFSPLLQVMHTGELERQFLMSGFGFSLSLVKDGCATQWTLPGLANADDLELKVGDMNTIQKLTDFSEEEMAAPGVTFANDIVCVSADTRAWLERRHWDIGRQALSCHGQVVIEAIQGDIGCKKPTLELYRTHKHYIGAEDFYNNNLGSRLRFEAQVGGLRTLSYRLRFDPAIVTIQFRVCDQESETIDHLVLHCPVLTPKWEVADQHAD
ncbi:hypothetical protein HPB47_021895 [Ixodes persulcatus]|uniref:Uncharacterized protein n=1 Tax=Ixodes persulcatus TaxID=34615 RepID=A0AC60QDW2_IXOPE|nr:hypothetical protein HPB47_021895 [Ixodes persulcatus]